MAEALNSAPDVRLALEKTLALAADLLGLQTGWVWLLDSDTGNFYSAASQNLPPYLQEPVRMTGWRCVCIQSFLEAKLQPENVDVLECSRLEPAVQAGDLDLTGGLRYHASIPLQFRGRPLGIINVTGPGWRRLTRQELQLLSTIAYQTGIAVERARLAEESTRVARAEERARIAREIHDTLAQDLTAVVLQLEGALNQLDRDPQRTRQRLEKALATTRASLEEARRSVLDLRGDSLPRPLPQALDALARSFTSETGVRVHVVAAANSPLSAQDESELFRIVQEALTNVRRHAHARSVEISLQRRRDTLRLSIKDDGGGFDPSSVGEGHHGLLGMHERARLLGGTLRVVSHRDAGTRISVSVPLKREGDL